MGLDIHRSSSAALTWIRHRCRCCSAPNTYRGSRFREAVRPLEDRRSVDERAVLRDLEADTYPHADPFKRWAERGCVLQLVWGSGEVQDRQVLRYVSWGSEAAIQSSARGCLRRAEYRVRGLSHKRFGTSHVPYRLLTRWLQLDRGLDRFLRISSLRIASYQMPAPS